MGFDCPRPASGAIKVLSLKTPYPASFVYAQAGVVGWVRHELEGHSNDYIHPGGISDSSMVALPSDLLTANSHYEFNKLLDFASQNCASDLH